MGSGTYENAPPMFTGTPYDDDNWVLAAMQKMYVHDSQNKTEITEFNQKEAIVFPSIWDVYHQLGYMSL